ncbi:oligosaccharide flippase family protein [Pacificoceanicola onchidii]|uniref:oligosaccharide flippase family protein n=1 Tax=Pacificoceanicola onchidii TaxID=2562685 RepID=UPI0010A5E773|nr:oligosaccharide flippase family protein [Pacificoceanicola onchidii]
MSETPNQRPAASGRTAAKGMAWTALALLVAKALSFVSQIALGYLLAVETYAVFAMLGSALIFVNGFQNSGVGKVLIAKQDQYDELLPSHSAFALWLGLIGMALFVVVGFVFQQFYEIRPLFWMIALAAFSLPLSAISTIYIAALSIDLRFRDLSLVEVQRSFFYYVVLVGAAALGAGGYTMAAAMSLGAAFFVLMLIRKTPQTKVSWRIAPRTFLRMLVELRWVLGSGFLLALGMKGDYLALGDILTPEELGYYYFGFVILVNLTTMISVGVNQTLMPLFAQLKADMPQLRRQYLRIGGATTMLMSLLSLSVIGFAPVMIHLVWGGKWDPSILVIVAIAVALPIRLTSNLAGVVFESQGAWGWRLLVLLWDAGFVVICALIGVYFGGMNGAAIAVACQRAMSGMLAFPLAARLIGLSVTRVAGFFIRCFGSYLVIVAVLIMIDPWRHVISGESTLILRPLLETGAAVLAFLGAQWLINRELVTAMIGLIRNRRKRKPA